MRICAHTRASRQAASCLATRNGNRNCTILCSTFTATRAAENINKASREMNYFPFVSLVPSPAPFPAGNSDPDIRTTAENSANETDTRIAFLALVPVAVILLVVVVALGAYCGQEEKAGHSNSRLCQLWQRINRRRSQSASAVSNAGFHNYLAIYSTLNSL